MSHAPHLTSATGEERPELLIFCGLGGLVGQIVPLATMIATMLLVDEYSFMADTISKLAKGNHHVVMDAGFYVSAGSLLALAIGAAHLHLGKWDWSLGIFALAFLALVVTLLGIWDEFSETPDPTPSVHARLTYALLPLYCAGPLLMARGIGHVWPAARWMFVASGMLWIALALWFYFSADSRDGAIEKAAFAATWAWTLPLAWVLLQRGRENL